MDKNSLISYAKTVETIGTDLEKIQGAVNSLFIKIIKYLATILQGTDFAVTLDDIGTKITLLNIASPEMKEKIAQSVSISMVLFGKSVSKSIDTFSLKSIAQMEYGPLINIDIIKQFIPNAESIKENVEKFTEIQKKLNDIIPEDEKDIIILSIKYLIKISAIYLKEYSKI
jgi:hypothetical protein